MKRSLVSIVFVGALLAPHVAWSQCSTSTCSSGGGVSMPAALDISLPFENGERVEILSGYGPSMGSSLHCRSQDSSCANDWYALDLILPDYANAGLGQPVLASAAGEVVSAGWSSQGWANYGRRVYIRHPNVGGNDYMTMYAHLDTVAVNDGQMVQKGQEIGTLGRSCQGAQQCGSFSTPHVHWSVHRNSNFGGSGSGGSYGGRAVIPEPLDGNSNIQQGQVLISRNGDMTMPVECDIVIGAMGDTIIPEDSNCGAPTGTPLAEFGGGEGGHAWTFALDNPSPDYEQGMFWLFDFAVAGRYEVFAHIPSGVGNLATAAEYKVKHDGINIIIPTDVNAAVGEWVSLGAFDFAAGDGQHVRLGDNYGLASDNGKTVVIDDMRVRALAACACTIQGTIESEACTGGGERTRTCDGCDWSAWTMCPGSMMDGMDARDGGDIPVVTLPDVGTLPDGGPEPTDATNDTGTNEANVSSCACRMQGQQQNPSPLLFGILFAAFWWQRRSPVRRRPES